MHVATARMVGAGQEEEQLQKGPSAPQPRAAHRAARVAAVKPGIPRSQPSAGDSALKV